MLVIGILREEPLFGVFARVALNLNDLLPQFHAGVGVLRRTDDDLFWVAVYGPVTSLLSLDGSGTDLVGQRLEFLRWHVARSHSGLHDVVIGVLEEGLALFLRLLLPGDEIQRTFDRAHDVGAFASDLPWLLCAAHVVGYARH